MVKADNAHAAGRRSPDARKGKQTFRKSGFSKSNLDPKLYHAKQRKASGKQALVLTATVSFDVQQA